MEAEANYDEQLTGIVICFQGKLAVAIRMIVPIENNNRIESESKIDFSQSNSSERAK